MKSFYLIPICSILAIIILIAGYFYIAKIVTDSGPYFSNFKSIEKMLEKTESRLGYLSEDGQWRTVDTLITAFNYFYDGDTITYEQILPLEKLWAEHLNGRIGVAEQPISVAIQKNLIAKAMPQDLTILPNQSIETLLGRNYFCGDKYLLIFSVDFVLKHLNGIYNAAEFLERPLTYPEMLKTTGALKARLFAEMYLTGKKTAVIPDTVFLEWFSNDIAGLSELLERFEFKVAPSAINNLMLYHPPDEKNAILFINSVCALLASDGRYINGRFSKHEFKILSDRVDMLIFTIAQLYDSEKISLACNELRSLFPLPKPVVSLNNARSVARDKRLF